MIESFVVKLRKEDPEQSGVHVPHATYPLQLERQKAGPLHLSGLTVLTPAWKQPGSPAALACQVPWAALTVTPGFVAYGSRCVFSQSFRFQKSPSSVTVT